jgi:hypothetical protein
MRTGRAGKESNDQRTESPAYGFIRERVALEFRKLEQDKVTPWAFFLSGKGVRLTNFLGKKIEYSGIGFEGSSRTVFWNGFIQPFLQDIVSRSFSETWSFCLEHGLEPKQPIVETASVLKTCINRIYGRMSDIDQKLRGKGYPKSVPKYDAIAERNRTEAFVEERLAAEIALAQKIDEDKQMKRNGQKKSVSVSTRQLEKDDVWGAIEAEYGESKRSFGKKINFVKDQFKRKVVFRDIEQAFLLANMGFSKPSVVLAGGVIEELLRLYLAEGKVIPAKYNLDAYIKACEDKGLLKTAIHRLADSIRQFRNIVHLERESSSKHSISKATAKGAVSSIFTIANDFST